MKRKGIRCWYLTLSSYGKSGRAIAAAAGGWVLYAVVEWFAMSSMGVPGCTRCYRYAAPPEL
jgi:hypothetical protein